MLERNSGPTEVLVINVMVERAINGPTEDQIENRICDALTWVEGIGSVNVIYQDRDFNDENGYGHAV